jgi:hypothetical protein
MRRITHWSLFFFLLLASSTALGQSNYASLSGTVFDPQQKAILGAAVQLTSESTHASRQATSSDQGIFQITGLWPGEYKLAVQAQGFASMTQNVTLEVGQQMTLDVSPRFRLSVLRSRSGLTPETCCELLTRASEKSSSRPRCATCRSMVAC